MTDEANLKALQRETGLEVWDPKRTPVHHRVIEAFPRELALRHRVFPVAMKRNSVGVSWFIATSDPTDEALRQRVGDALCTPDDPVVVAWFISTASIIDAAIAEHYPAPAPAEEPVIILEEAVELEEQPPVLLARIAIAKTRSPSSQE